MKYKFSILALVSGLVLSVGCVTIFTNLELGCSNNTIGVLVGTMITACGGVLLGWSLHD